MNIQIILTATSFFRILSKVVYMDWIEYRNRDIWALGRTFFIPEGRTTLLRPEFMRNSYEYRFSHRVRGSQWSLLSWKGTAPEIYGKFIQFAIFFWLWSDPMLTNGQCLCTKRPVNQITCAFVRNKFINQRLIKIEQIDVSLKLSCLIGRFVWYLIVIGWNER